MFLYIVFQMELLEDIPLQSLDALVDATKHAFEVVHPFLQKLCTCAMPDVEVNVHIRFILMSIIWFIYTQLIFTTIFRWFPS